MSLHVKCESRKVSLPSPRIENLEKVVQVGFERGYISLGRSFTITWWCGCMQQASPNQYRYKIREQSCATVSSVAVARQGAQCGARLHRWIKVRSAGHDIPRSTRSMKVGTNNFASGKSKRARYVQKFSLLSPVALLHSSHFPPNIYTFDTSFRSSTERKSRENCRSNTYRELSLPESTPEAKRCYSSIFSLFWCGQRDVHARFKVKIPRETVVNYCRKIFVSHRGK